MPSTPMPKVELPVQDSAHHQFWRTPLWSWWRPMVAVVLGLLAFFVLSMIAGMVAIGLDMASGRTTVEDLQNMDAESIKATPALFLVNNISLALLIPLAILLSVWLFRQKGGWLVSVTGRIRWGWMGRCFAVLGPLWLVYVGLDTWLRARSGEGLGLHVNSDTWLLLFGILLTTPFQAAGEEYGFRAVLMRSAASFFRHRWLGFAVGAIFSSVLFMFAHGAGDMWLNIFYFCFGLIACGMTLRTGGIEAAIAMHVVNNVLSELTMPFTDISGIFNREAGTADATVLVGVLVPLIGWALVEWQARKSDVVASAAPGLARQQELDEQLATWQQQMITWQRAQAGPGSTL
ncbi:membrane protease YdiL (CAAX protease family) [Luteococcus japonicus]|nr:CPBP family intramembrane glutamic endopeptidase [Luteococcus japonicus]ROR53550.1 membrane protease YdiL (CAAX protease family) [Luteococcus japonicus]